MVEGFWIVQFAGMEGKGGGVVVLTNGKVFGGDSAFTYVGNYRETGVKVTATIRVHNFEPAIGSVTGMKGDHTLQLDVHLQNETVLVGSGSVLGQSGFGVKVKLTRQTTL
jgi:hypothetical protein